MALPELVRRLTMALLMLTHLQFASFLIGVFTLGVAVEFLWVLSRHNEWLLRLAKGLSLTAVILYGYGAVLAIMFVLLIALMWPTFWIGLVQINFWPFVLEGITFVLTILYLFPWHYTWNSLARFPAVHLSLGLALAVVAQLQQAMIDIVAGYMLTPVPPENQLRLFLNPTAIPLDMHRLAGDLSLAGFFIAAFAAFRTLRSRQSADRAYYDWMGHIGLITGLGFLFIQPAVGLSYVEEIRANAPGAFSQMMRGSLSWVFLVQIFILSVLFFLGVLYMWLQVRKSGRQGGGVLRAMLVLVGLSGLLAIQPYVIGPSQDYAWVAWVNPLGAMQPWKYLALAGLSLGALVATVVYLGASQRGLRWGELAAGGRRAQYTLLVLGVAVSLMMLVMGYIRESGRLPFLIYNQYTVEEQERFTPLPPPEVGR
ncbi:MAG: cytochrome ubiquinol oxidase subunit I [Chloroflexota bacterium]